MKPLTWYPGTVLPHASLWHTLLRATWLNDLRPGEICDFAGKGRGHASEDGYSTSDQNVIGLVAKILGEPRSAFSRYALLTQFPRAVFPLFLARDLRWCPACLDAGFHSLLMSLQLVVQCPIHHIPLIERCPSCGQSVNMSFRGLVVRRTLCACGKDRFFEPDVIRQPKLLPKEVEPWNSAATWLRKVHRVCMSAAPELTPSLRIQMALTPRWSRDLGIDYPSCFADEADLWEHTDESARWMTYRARSGELDGHQLRLSETDSVPSPQASVYRAMGRHLRRHGLPNPDRWIQPLLETHDPVTFALRMAERPKMRTAFSEMIWTRSLEPHAFVRRWPARAAPNIFGWGNHTPLELGSSEYLKFRGTALPQITQWLGYHAMAMQALLAWGNAVQQTQTSVDKQWADWSVTERALNGRIAWFSRSKGRRQILVGYLRDINIAPFAPPRKEARRDVTMPSRLPGNLPTGRCLEWDLKTGWRVCLGCLPTKGADARLVRLLHAGVPLKCWIFEAKGRFFARLTDGSIQSIGDSPKEVLNGLRSAVTQYCRVYGETHFKLSRVPLPQTQQPRPGAWVASSVITSIYPPLGPTRFWGVGAIELEMAHRLFMLKMQKWGRG